MNCKETVYCEHCHCWLFVRRTYDGEADRLTGEPEESLFDC